MGMTKNDMPTTKCSIKSSRRPRTALVLDLGQDISLTVKRGSGTAEKTDISRLVANFQDAVNEPQQGYSLKDYCGESFFKRKSGSGSQELYSRTQDGSADGAEWFVEYGAHVGSLIANLEMLLKPSRIVLTGPLTAWFDAWNHAMGKARKQHLGERPGLNVEVSKKKATSLKTVKSAKHKTKKRK
jgi:predicted NBD/HSP70 family sugar kinase